jgi:hypothetical protein
VSLAHAVPLLNRQIQLGDYLTSCACELQNAMASTFSGSVVRTAHIAGMLTDLGIFFGHSLRGHAVDTRRLRLCVIIVGGFLDGDTAGTIVFPALGYGTFFIPAALTGLAATGYTLSQLRPKPTSAA